MFTQLSGWPGVTTGGAAGNAAGNAAAEVLVGAGAAWTTAAGATVAETATAKVVTVKRARESADLMNKKSSNMNEIQPRPREVPQYN
ncbi:hypothetical protein GCM10009569_34530 [Arthrobacter russicus]